MSNTISGFISVALPNTLDNENIIESSLSGYLPLDGSGVMLGDLDMGTHSIKNLASALNNDEAVNLGQLITRLNAYVTLNTAQTITSSKAFLTTIGTPLELRRLNGTIANQLRYVTTSGTISWLIGQIPNDTEYEFRRLVGVTPTTIMRLTSIETIIYTPLNMSSQKITNLLDGTNNNDAVNLSQLNTKLNLSGGTMTGNINCNNLYRINNVIDPVSNQDVATKFYVDNHTSGSYLPLAGGTMAGNINCNNLYRVNNVIDPVSNQDVATKFYVDNHTSTNYLPLAGGTMTGNINCNNLYRVNNVIDPVSNQDVATKFYVDNHTSTNYLPLAGGTMAGNINCNNLYRINNVINPVSAQDVSTKSYVDNNFVTLSTNQTIFGIKTFRDTGGSGYLIIDRNATNLSHYIDYRTNLILRWRIGNNGDSTDNFIFSKDGLTPVITINYSSPSLSLNSYKIENLANGTNNNDAVNKSQLDTKLNLSGGTMTGDINCNNLYRINNVINPVSAQDVATKNYTDTNFVTLATAQSISGDKTFNSYTFLNKEVYITNAADTSYKTSVILERINGNRDNTIEFSSSASLRWSMGLDANVENFYIKKVSTTILSIDYNNPSLSLNSYKIENLANGTNSGDAVNKSQLDTKLNLSGGTMTGVIAMGTNKITGLANGTTTNDAVNFGQLTNGKTLSTTANITYDNEDLIEMSSGVNRTITFNNINNYYSGKRFEMIINNNGLFNTTFTFSITGTGIFPDGTTTKTQILTAGQIKRYSCVMENVNANRLFISDLSYL